MKNQKIFQLRAKLRELTRSAGLVAVKSGTEVEDMSFGEIALILEITNGIIPLYVKIGGAEARNDIRELSILGVQGMISPMIESPYALRKYVESMIDLVPVHRYRKLVKGINLETITGYQHLSEIIERPEMKEISRVTAARSDLSASMDLSPDDDLVMETCASIVKIAHIAGKRCSVGGSIHGENAAAVIAKIRSEEINTRHMVIDSNVIEQGNASRLLELHLDFELALYEYLAEHYAGSEEIYRNRMNEIRNRIQKSASSSPALAAAKV